MSPCTITITDPTTALPIARMAVWATSDAGGLSVAAGPALTDVTGSATLSLTAGQQYYLTGLKLGVTPLVNVSFVAVADAGGA